MIIENPEMFRSWLAIVLEPLCDADPPALAKYVYALVKKDKPVNDIRESMIDQLDVFLQQETKSFVALLFKTIENKEYLNMAPVGKPETTPQQQQQPPATEDNTEKAKETSVVNDNDKPDELNDDTSDKLIADGDGTISSTEEKQEAMQIQSSIVSEGAKNEDVASGGDDKKDDKPKKDSEKEERFKLNRSKIRGAEPPVLKAYRSRSRSWDRTDRTKRSRSRDRELGRDRGRDRERVRTYRNKSPPRRFDRRRSYSRSTSPPRLRSFFSRSESRSPKFPNRGRFRNRSPPSRSRSPRTRSRSGTRSRSRSFEGRRKSPFIPGGLRGELDSRLPPITSAPHLKGLRKNDMPPLGINNRRCRDFDEKGFCMRGDLCPFDHGTDPVVLLDLALPEVLTFGPGMAPPMIPQPGGMHDINQPMSNMLPMQPPGIRPGPIPAPPQQLLPRNQPPHMLIRGPPSHMLIRGPAQYNPDAPSLNPLNWGKQPFHMRGRGVHNQQRELINITPDDPGFSRQRRGKERFDPNRQNNFDYRCLQLRKVPPGLNNITHLNNHFAKFGKIVNIQVSYDNDPESALVTFSSPAEASAAYYSTEAVLNNRFILVFWHNPKKQTDNNNKTWGVKDRTQNPQQPASSEGQEIENNATEPGAGTAANTNTNSAVKTDKIVTSEEKKAQEVAAIIKGQEMLERSSILKKKTEEKRKEAIKLTSDLRKRSQTLLEKQIEQQKELIKKLESGSLDEPQKKVVKETIIVLQNSIEKIKKELLSVVSKPAKAKPVRKSKDDVQREMLDTELDIINKQQEGEDTSMLQKKLINLKLEMSKFSGKPVRIARSILPTRSQLVKNKLSINRTFKKTKINNKVTVDHRPTKILVSGYENDEKDLVLGHFRQYGEIADYISDDSTPSIVLNFKTRKEAEDAMVRGKSFQDRLLSVTWFTNANVQLRRRNSSVSGPTYHMHAGRQVLLSSSEPDMDDILADNDAGSEVEGSFEITEELLLQDDDEDIEDEERSWRR